MWPRGGLGPGERGGLKKEKTHLASVLAMYTISVYALSCLYIATSQDYLVAIFLLFCMSLALL